MRALIIEDEILASKHLQQVLGEVGDISVITVLESIYETVEWFRKNQQPDIVFMDIHLADGSAFEIFKQINITCPIVFTTAYDKYALNAFKVNSIDYLLKPVEAGEVQNALKKLKGLSLPESFNAALNNLITSYRRTSKYKKHFLIPSKGDKLIPGLSVNLKISVPEKILISKARITEFKKWFGE